MKYLRTRLGTDWGDPSDEGVIAKALRRFLPDANPSYRKNMHLLDAWYIEFMDDGFPYREVGVDADDVPVLAGPSSSDYGFWLDTNMRFSDFDGVEIDKDQFESIWARATGRP